MFEIIRMFLSLTFPIMYIAFSRGLSTRSLEVFVLGFPDTAGNCGADLSEKWPWLTIPGSNGPASRRIFSVILIYLNHI